MDARILFAGFGGQGILFAGKLLANKALIEDRYISWLPSYGPEMRGGTANCAVCIGASPIGSPIVNDPDILVAMNLPSLDKYEAAVQPGGMIFVDSTLIERKVTRDDVKVFYIPATAMAREMNAPTLANMIILGKLLKELPELGTANIEAALKKVISARHMDLLEVNLNAIRAGENA